MAVPLQQPNTGHYISEQDILMGPHLASSLRTNKLINIFSNFKTVLIFLGYTFSYAQSPVFNFIDCWLSTIIFYQRICVAHLRIVMKRKKLFNHEQFKPFTTQQVIHSSSLYSQISCPKFPIPDQNTIYSQEALSIIWNFLIYYTILQPVDRLVKTLLYYLDQS